MTRASHLLPLLRSTILAGLASATALAVGATTAWQPVIGIGLLVGGAYAAAAMRSLSTAVTMWIPSFFIAFFVVGNAWLKGGLVVTIFVAAATIGRDRALLRRASGQSRPVLALLAGVLLWFVLSAVWSSDAAAAVSEWLKVLLSATVFALVLLAVRTTAQARAMVMAFVGAGVFSAVIGLVGFSTAPANPDAASELAAEGRITAWAGDPNVLAASLVATAVLALTLAARARGPGRLLLSVGALLSVVGVAATQSRGGLVSAAVALAATMILFRRHAARTVPLALALVIAMSAYLAVVPGAANRLTVSGDAGSGRSELWTVAWRGFKDHPVNGIGLNQFRLESSRYVLEPGTLRYVKLISERPLVVHNTYLQYLVETGVIGSLLFLGFLAACLSAHHRAIRLFDDARRSGDAHLARGVLVATLTLLGAGMFVSAGVDYKTWLLLALGPALLAVARRDSDLESRSPEAMLAGVSRPLD